MATPMIVRDDHPSAERAIAQLLRAIGEDPGREGLEKTPERVAKAMSFLNSGASKTALDVLNGAIFNESYEGMVLVQDIEFYSLCEHHLLPFHGRAHIAYLPAGQVIGLSKLPRLLDVFARRLQVQERLTDQVARAVQQAIEPRGVAVRLEAAHFCMMMRGVEKQRSITLTSSFLGAFDRDMDLRQEFYSALGARPDQVPHGPRERLSTIVSSHAPSVPEGCRIRSPRRDPPGSACSPRSPPRFLAASTRSASGPVRSCSGDETWRPLRIRLPPGPPRDSLGPVAAME